MSIAIKQSHRTVILLFIFTSITCLWSCEKQDSKMAKLHGNVHNFRSSKTIDANNLVSLAILSKTTIEKNTKLSAESENKRILNFSKAVDKNQNEFLESITKLANSKLIIITNISKIKTNTNTDTITRDALYFYSIEENLNKEIALLNKLKSQTIDAEIHKFAQERLKRQNHMLEQTKRFKYKIINNENTQIK